MTNCCRPVFTEVVRHLETGGGHQQLDQANTSGSGKHNMKRETRQDVGNMTGRGKHDRVRETGRVQGHTTGRGKHNENGQMWQDQGNTP